MSKNMKIAPDAVRVELQGPLQELKPVRQNPGNLGEALNKRSGKVSVLSHCGERPGKMTG